MTFKDHCLDVYDAVGARLSGLHHLLRGHKVRWRAEVDLWTGHTGCLLCDECPDTTIEDGKHVGLAIWCRQWRWMWWCGQHICGWLGHAERRHPQRPDGDGWVDIPGEWYCYRCLADL